MKKYILMPVLAALSLSGSVAQAQDFDNKPVVNVSNSYYRCAHPYLYEL